MAGPPGDRRTSPVELQDQIKAEREGDPFLVFRRQEGAQEIFGLGPDIYSVVIGRADTCDIALPGDEEISRVHAILERVGEDWAVVDDGLSQNGTFVNGERVQGRRRLRGGDSIRIGAVGIAFRAPDHAGIAATAKAAEAGPSRISEAQRRVLVALCRPYRDGGGFSAPATNKQIAEELVLGIDAIKSHMRALYERFEVEDLPQQQKRARLVELAFRSGEISARDLDG